LLGAIIGAQHVDWAKLGDAPVQFVGGQITSKASIGSRTVLKRGRAIVRFTPLLRKFGLMPFPFAWNQLTSLPGRIFLTATGSTWPKNALGAPYEIDAAKGRPQGNKVQENNASSHDWIRARSVNATCRTEPTADG
jgi:hypothetical protein